VLLVLAALLFFADLVAHPGQILYSDYSDLLPLHLPSKCFLVGSWRETGELPLWCPYAFSGTPFLHDTQVSAFYPPELPLYALTEKQMGAAMSWLLVLHVIAAGLCMYAYAREQQLESMPALLAALGYMFAGKWMVHLLTAGHYNMLPLAWLPLLLLWLERAIRQGRLLFATGAGAVFALFILKAYPYVTLYAGLFAGMWTLGSALEQAGYLGGVGPRSRRRTLIALARWLAYGGWTVVIGAALGAAQLLPSLEAAREATRSLGVAPSWNMFRDGLESLVNLVGPALTAERHWDYEGRLGLLWLGLAVLAPWLCPGRVRFEATVATLIVAYVVVGAVFLQVLPGFRLFRLPTRMLLVLALPVALLAGRSVQALLQGNATADVVKGSRGLVLRVLLVVAVLQGGYALARYVGPAREDPVTGGLQTTLHFHIYWAIVPFTLVVFFWLLGQVSQRSRLAWCWLALLTVDLWTVLGPIARVRAHDAIFAPSRCVSQLAEIARTQPGRIMDREPPRSSSTPLWPALPMMMRLESLGGFNPTDIRRYKEYLQFISGSDEPLRPPQGVFTSPVLGSFAVKNKPLADLLGVRYLVQPVGLNFENEGEPPADRDPRWQKIGPDDPAPRAFDFIAGGIQTLPPYSLYENRETYPRAFVVHQALPLPDPPNILPTLEHTDFHRVVLLEGTAPAIEENTDVAEPRTAVVTRSLPNQVVVSVSPGRAGYLVLADIWFPGWKCTVDSRPVPVHRADYLFRAVPISASAREAIFTFAPDSYAWGKEITAAAMIFLIGSTLVAVAGRRHRVSGEKS
jgi:hypothetical protein